MINDNDLLPFSELLLIAPFYGDFQSIHQEWLGTLSLYSVLNILNGGRCLKE